MESAVLDKIFKSLDEETLSAILIARAELIDCINKINAIETPETITPRPELIFRAFELCPWKSIRVVIIGQDPYPDRDLATGLSFSVPNKAKLPVSYKNIINSMRNNGVITDEQYIYMKNGASSLEYLARQGVLLLNASLTTRVGVPNAHSVWQNYTNKLIKKLSDDKNKLVFILWGEFAKKKKMYIDTVKHKILTWGHPSAVNRANTNISNPDNFIYCTNFTECNDVLAAAPIAWGQVIPADFDITSAKKDKNVGTKYIAPKAAKSDNNNEDSKKDVDEVVSKIKNTANTVNTVNTANINTTTNVNTVNTVNTANVNTTTLNTANVNTSKTKEKKQKTESIINLNQPDVNYVPTKLILAVDGSSKWNGSEKCVASYAYAVYDYNKLIHSDAQVVPPIYIPGKKYRTSNNRGELSAMLYGITYLGNILLGGQPAICNIHTVNTVNTANNANTANNSNNSNTTNNANTVNTTKHTLNVNNVKSILILSDSEYSIKCISEWAPKWIRDNKLDDKENTDLILSIIQRLNILKGKYACTFQHIRSHKNPPNVSDTEQYMYWALNDFVDKSAGDVLSGYVQTNK